MMVRLEVSVKGISTSRTNAFQFHDGAIGSDINKLTANADPPFQFHDGAIGSRKYECLWWVC